jgi:hypothetical protein
MFGRAGRGKRKPRSGVGGPGRRVNWMDGGHDTKGGWASRTRCDVEDGMAGCVWWEVEGVSEGVEEYGMRQTYMQQCTTVDTSTTAIQHGTAPTAYLASLYVYCICRRRSGLLQRRWAQQI